MVGPISIRHASSCIGRGCFGGVRAGLGRSGGRRACAGSGDRVRYSSDVRLRAHRMFAAGAEYAEVEHATGVNISTLRNWKYAKGCVDCGRPVADAVTARCVACADAAKTYWTPERIINAVQKFVARYGRTPTATDWNPSQAVEIGRTEIAARFYEDGCWPHQYTCQRLIGSLNQAVELAGYRPRPSGHRIGMRPWPREAILEALREWVRLNGETPSALQWKHATEDHPATSCVQKAFGTWNAAVSHAGFATRAPSEKRLRKRVVA